jgi:hypothetical protein
MKLLVGICVVAAAIALPCTGAETPANQRFKTCQAKLKKAKQLDVLYDMAWDKGSGPRILVGPTYFQIPVDAKEGFAETLNCFLVAGASDQCMNFSLSDWRTGKAVARFENCRLKID